MGKGKIVTVEDRIPKLKTERKRKANRRFVIYLSFFFLLILVIIYFQSPLSRIKNIHVQGSHYANQENIISTSGLTNETSFWNLNKEKVISKIEEIDQISSADIEKKFPNSITIIINEYNRVGYLNSGEKYYPILENGKVLPALKKHEVPINAPLLLNWQDKEKELQEMAYELNRVPQSIIQRISEIHLAPLESDPLRLILYMTDGFEVHSTIQDFADKITAYPAIVQELGSEQQGIIYINVGSYFKAYETEEALERESEG
ncbi:cell division protein FtsQ/DivIB [Bacillus taeanensis]|uniref:Cell division protein DivIB n=1 Tax=Bacillus taeanensis TaxID=273032 RepID=A0A366Y1V8_9BACI|nr:FtsQ-type POTRA domain-containing protein [Bacillus taeanensis]RBW70393.1 cell division protein FtsQ [Bacillus taeanensis]